MITKVIAVPAEFNPEPTRLKAVKTPRAKAAPITIQTLSLTIGPRLPVTTASVNMGMNAINMRVTPKPPWAKRYFPPDCLPRKIKATMQRTRGRSTHDGKLKNRMPTINPIISPTIRPEKSAK